MTEEIEKQIARSKHGLGSPVKIKDVNIRTETRAQYRTLTV